MIRLKPILNEIGGTMAKNTQRALAFDPSKERGDRYYFIDEDGAMIRTTNSLKTKSSVQKEIKYLRRRLYNNEPISYIKGGNPNPPNTSFWGPDSKMTVVDSRTGQIYNVTSFRGFTATGKKWAKKLGIVL